MVNQIVITGKIKNKNAKVFDDKFNQGEKIYATTLMVGQRVATGQGFNGTDWDNKFFNVKYSTKALKKGKYDGQIEDDSYVIVVGRLTQQSYNDQTTNAQKQSTVIVADEISVISQKQGTQNYQYNNYQTTTQQATATQFPNDDDSVLWDD